MVRIIGALVTLLYTNLHHGNDKLDLLNRKILINAIAIILNFILIFLSTDHVMQKASAQVLSFSNTTNSSITGNNATNATNATPANISSTLGKPFYTEPFRLIIGSGSPSIMNSTGEVPAIQLTYKGNISIGGVDVTDSGQYLLTFASTGHGTSGTGVYKNPEYLRGEGVINASDGERAIYLFQGIGYTYGNGTHHTYNGILVFIAAPSSGKLAILNTPSNLFRMNFELVRGNGTINVWRWG